MEKVTQILIIYLDDFEISYPDAIPLNELFSLIDEHFAYRKEI